MPVLEAEAPYLTEVDEYADMDEDLKVALKALTRSTDVLLRSAEHPRTSEAAPQKTPRITTAQMTLAIVVSVLVILGVFFQVLRYTVSSEIAAAFVMPNQQITSLADDVKYLRRDVDELRSQHSAEVFQHSSDASPKDVLEAAAQLQKEHLAIPRDQVVTAGKAILKTVSVSSDEKWEATNAVLSYLSFLNNTSAPIWVEQIGPPTFANAYHHPDGWNGQMKWVGSSPAPDVPALHSIGSPDPNAHTSGPAYLILEGGTVKIDNLQMKRIIVRNAHVVYDGGPLLLEKVYFLNCTFSISHQKQGEMLASAIISPDPQTSFAAS